MKIRKTAPAITAARKIHARIAPAAKSDDGPEAFADTTAEAHALTA